MTTVWLMGSTWWKERTNSPLHWLASDPHIHTILYMHAHAQINIKRKKGKEKWMTDAFMERGRQL